MALNQKVVDKFFFFFLRFAQGGWELARAPGHSVSYSLSLSSSLPAFLSPFLFHYPSLSFISFPLLSFSFFAPPPLPSDLSLRVSAPQSAAGALWSGHPRGG